MLEEEADQSTGNGVTDRGPPEFWVFGYGSLLWKQGFPFVAEERARLDGYHRALCIHSWRHRGTEQQPGLVLGLQGGGACDGMAYLVEEAHREDTIAYLRERELTTNVYLERMLPVRLVDQNRTVRCLAYVVDPTHQQFAPPMPMDEAVARIEKAKGMGGPNRDYVLNTVDRLREAGIDDPPLEKIAERLRVG